MEIDKSDVTIDNDGDGGTLKGTVEFLGGSHTLEMCGGGRDLSIELDGNWLDGEGLYSEFSEWDEPYDAIQDAIKAWLKANNREEDEKYEFEDFTARVVNGKVVRLLILDGRGISVVVGSLVDKDSLAWSYAQDLRDLVNGDNMEVLTPIVAFLQSLV